MIITTLNKLLVMTALGSLMTSCCVFKRQCHIVKVSKDEKEALRYMRDKGINSTTLSKLAKGNGDECTTVCCDTLKFCSIPKDKAKEYITHYRNENWFDSSPYFHNDDAPIHRDSIVSVMREITNGEYDTGDIADPYMEPDNFDSRFMDIPIYQLENYLCMLRNTPGLKEANYCRFYYMKYSEDPEIDANFWNKTTLALVPVALDTTGGQLSTLEFTDPIYYDRERLIESPIMVVGGSCDDDSGMANHNKLCPPFKNCTVNTLLNEVDQ